MKYRYHYRNRDNEALAGWIVAKDRNDAYAKLKAQGIKPFKVEGKDPVAWKRWAAIAVLAGACLSLARALLKVEAEERMEPRAQLYGDPAIIQQLSASGWREAFGGDEGDAWLARHAIPASTCDCSEGQRPELDVKPVRISPDESAEKKKMARMVNWMKAELEAYLQGGGTAEDYMALCDERLETERGIVAAYHADFETLLRRGEEAGEAWEKKNAELRSMGLPTVIMPD